MIRVNQLRRAIVKTHRQSLLSSNKKNQKYHHHTISLSSLSSLPSSPYIFNNDDKSSNNSNISDNKRYLTTVTQITKRKDVHIQAQAQQKKQFQMYHTTTKKEIIPLIAVGALGFIGTYSFKALKRMDEEWEEYEEALREYKLEHGLSDDEIDTIRTSAANANADGNASTSTSTSSNVFQQGKMAIDLGSVNIRIAHEQNRNHNNEKRNKPKIVVNREGGRSTPNSIIVETDGLTVTGQMASAKIYERSQSNNPVLNPYNLLSSLSKSNLKSTNDADEITTNCAVQVAISSLAKDALEQVLGGNKTDNSNFLFSVNDYDGYNTQPIFTYPPSITTDGNDNNDDEEYYVKLYQRALSEMLSSTSIAKFVPEPICAVKGARYHNLLPSTSESPSVMVIDIGGQTTSISIVNENEKSNKIQYHSRLDNFGGETIIQSLMNHLSKSFYGTGIDQVSDTMGVQRLYDASKSAVMEIGGSKHGRVQINVPYLSVDEKMQPKHLDVGLSNKVLEDVFGDMIQSDIIPKVSGQNGDTSDVLSQSMNTPNDLESLLSSMIMKVFEKSGQNPFTLNSVLIIGGGARSPMFQKGLKAAFGKLAGEQFVEDKVIIPKDAKVEEMVVIGAVLSSDD